jgi:hypothetical protein
MEQKIGEREVGMKLLPTLCGVAAEHTVDNGPTFRVQYNMNLDAASSLKARSMLYELARKGGPSLTG